VIVFLFFKLFFVSDAHSGGTEDKKTKEAVIQPMRDFKDYLTGLQQELVLSFIQFTLVTFQFMFVESEPIRL